MSMKRMLSVCAVALFAVSAYAQTADELLDKNAAAMGGKDKLKALQSMRMTGKMKMGPMEAPFTLTKARPAAMRMDFTIQQMTATQAYDGTTAWMIMPFGGNKDPQVIGGEMLKAVKEQADFDGPTFDYKAKGNKVEYVGKEDVEGSPAYKLKVTTKDGLVSYEFLDAETYLPIRSESTRNMGGQEVESVTTYGAYKTVDGFTFPYSIDMHPKGAPSGQSIVVEKIELNPKVDTAMFTMPKVEKPADKPAEKPAEKKDEPKKP